jgi:hypothetical protein
MRLQFDGIHFQTLPEYEVSNLTELYQSTGLSNIGFQFKVRVNDATAHEQVVEGGAWFIFSPSQFKKYPNNPEKYWKIEDRDQIQGEVIDEVSGEIIVDPLNAEQGIIELTSEPISSKFIATIVRHQVQVADYLIWEYDDTVVPIYELRGDKHYAIYHKDYIGFIADLKWSSIATVIDGVRVSFNQILDSIPTEGSNNGVESDGIYKEIRRVEQNITAILNTTQQMVTGAGNLIGGIYDNLIDVPSATELDFLGMVKIYVRETQLYYLATEIPDGNGGYEYVWRQIYIGANL